MKSLKITALLLTLLAAPALAQSNTVSGTWKVTGEVSGYTIDQVCTLTQDEKKLTGSCKSASAEKPYELTGEVDDKKVTWKYDADFQGQKITLTFKGTLDASSQLKGDIDVQPFNVTGTFSAAKEEAKKEEPKKPQ